MTVDSLTSILEEEFALAFTVKDEKALRRSLTLLTGNMVAKEEYHREHDSLSSDIKLIATRMEEGFKRMDSRFEAMDLRFEASDKRFETVNKRFEAVDKRFDNVDKRFEAVDKRFDNVDKRFDTVDKRFDAVESRFNRITGLISLGFITITVLITVFQFLG